MISSLVHKNFSMKSLFSKKYLGLSSNIVILFGINFKLFTTYLIVSIIFFSAVSTITLFI
ncbi:hypothetical protein HOF65_03065 [bacterium]|nr:hypothetical protein [bacterium]MBT3852976.1 hypothetical protein [bacterium]MBT4633242.1 hypothetical protein [bacterium]MBT6779000.1 hypothetical protein [bacterium]